MSLMSNYNLGASSSHLAKNNACIHDNYSPQRKSVVQGLKELSEYVRPTQ